MEHSMDTSKEMHLLKRNGSIEDVSFDKILNRVKILGMERNPTININYSKLVMKVIDQLHDNIPTSKIDELTAEHARLYRHSYYNYGELANCRIIISNNHKNTNSSFFLCYE